MIHTWIFSKCSLKSMIYFLLLIVIYVFIHLFFLNHVITYNISSILSTTKRFRKSQSSDLKYILLWSKYSDYIQIKGGKVILPSLNCSISNCVFTKDKELFDDYTRFDAILFNEEILLTGNRPAKRGPSQIYVFNAFQSSHSFPACEPQDDGFFNWSLTYRLDSDIVWSYFIVRNLKGDIIAPRTTVTWQRNYYPVDPEIKTILAGKRKAAAWLVSHCKADSLRDEYLTRLQEHLFHFALKIDVYGKCTQEKCTRGDCDAMIKKDYYFYMAFENSLAEDYVTGTVLHGYNNYAVPIVYGGANYSRFLPAGSYINARLMHPYNLAFAMYQAIKTPALYETYFEWTSLYTIDKNFGNHHPFCNLCSALVQKRPAPVKNKFRLCWNGLNGFKWCLSKEYWKEASRINLDWKYLFSMY